MSYLLTPGQISGFTLLAILYSACLLTQKLSLGLVTAKVRVWTAISPGKKIQSFYSLTMLYNLGNPGATSTLILISYMESTAKSKKLVVEGAGRSFLNDFFENVILDLYIVKRIKK